MPTSPKSNTVVPIILCGGSGTRLWPLSRSGFPKQFLVLSGDSEKTSLFQQAVGRVNTLNNSVNQVGKTIVVTNEEHRFLAQEQLRELRSIQANLLLEPAGRNTAPALTLAALLALESASDPILLVTPADQTIQNSAAFQNAIEQSIDQAATGAIVILGITPTSAETGYGYIKTQKNKQAFVVERFVEKPDFKTAHAYLQEGGYFWNGGMFVLKASVWLAAIKEFRADIFEATAKAWQGHSVDTTPIANFIRPNQTAFEQIPSESIDYAVMEKLAGSKFVLQMVELNAGWNDLGTWDAVWQVGKKDPHNNVTSGDTLLVDTSSSLVHASSRLVAVVGGKNLIVVETPDAVLVADRTKSQDVKNIVATLETQGREEKTLHRKVARPWGWYDSIDEGDRFKVKRIQVKPGASLSLQRHTHRAEHWIVVKGEAEITNGDQVIRLKENQSTFIPQGQVHRLANLGSTPLEIIEVQSGSYLGEDDIVRLEDTYGRS
ncbi:mannose-1-phosphate guanylyltransferase/mannose-6-phosphate isomerase [Polynucleobacter paneuropaeus]|nr:mannose-1-phosphate guanylyltransferase/mannose-6-phosphate isomerase [Polynucleobacter paneuropaeus]QWD12991.1 mannose-1-phosphate guanylyltransferase/mannose-6-phosphate isomerase [Polynucleobacter paneuropaeus]QWD39323.1 mannose-1-phosphate guanylyltransferase/mannose-6-phosphate isomerase [Polynucleobacter paneuropaeus]